MLNMNWEWEEQNVSLYNLLFTCYFGQEKTGSGRGKMVEMMQ
jgi:hypothetical protein